MVRLAIFLIGLFSSALIYQNCAEVGGNSPWAAVGVGSFCTGQDCSNGTGDPNKLSIQVETDANQTSPSRIVSITDSEVAFRGNCDDGGFKRTRLDWGFLDSDGRVVKSGSEMGVKGCERGRFEIVITEFHKLNLSGNGQAKFEVALLGLDDLDNPFRGPGSRDEMSVLTQAIPPSPYLDTRAGQTNVLGDYWSYDFIRVEKIIGDRFEFKFQENGVKRSSITGFCHRDPNGLSPNKVNVLIREDPVHSANQSIDFALIENVPCQPLPAGSTQPPNASYNGYFSASTGVRTIPSRGGYNFWRKTADGIESNSRTYEIFLSQKDYKGTEFRSAKAKRLDLRFVDYDQGGGWSVPVAQKFLSQLHETLAMGRTAAAVRPVDVNNLTSPESRKTSQSGEAFGLRIYMRNFLGLTESIESGRGVVLYSSSGGLPGFKNTGTFLYRLFQISGGVGGSPCDPSQANASTAGEITLSSGSSGGSTNVELSRLTRCMVYWLHAGLIDVASTESWMKDLISADRITYPNSGDTTKCYIEGDLGRPISEGACVILDRFHKTMSNYLVAQNQTNMALSTLDDSDDLKRQRFYDALIQGYMNLLMEFTGCNFHPESGLSWAMIPTMKGVYGMSLDELKSFRSSHVVNPLFPWEKTLYSEPFQVFPRQATQASESSCGSMDAVGSFSPVWN
ncbi:MAG: hypothetical protein COT74_10065 [Bdellovibrionales bacterium CG10_big_fil_rev_8_21_14_0_10_45_34]|nr:MAG: hypothetical protein COT74_10065 [Bdellovibrionales bacterium CG10_big_fil_rev_8_21_14_0_10_45_34]